VAKNDEYASKVSQSGPFYDGLDAQRADTGNYDGSAVNAARNQQSYQDKSKSPFVNIRDGR